MLPRVTLKVPLIFKKCKFFIAYLEVDFGVNVYVDKNNIEAIARFDTE